MNIHNRRSDKEASSKQPAPNNEPQPTDGTSHFKRPMYFPHPGGHAEPSTEHEKALFDFLQSRLKWAEDIVQHSQNNMPMLREIEFILQYGRFFTPRQLPTTYKPGKSQACYANSQLYVAKYADLTYVEGYGWYRFSHPHAWCIDAEGQVIERTWTGQMGRPIAQAYFGVPLDRSYVTDLMSTRKGLPDALLIPDAFAE